jgi:hypothetical protein
MANTFRTVLHGRLVEFRHGDLAGETVLLDGRIISSKPFAGLYSPSHFFNIIDEHGKTRHIEMKVQFRWHGMSARVRVSVDGVPRAVLEPARASERLGCCIACGYELKELAAENGEVKCPECGKHTPAAFVDAADQ